MFTIHIWTQRRGFRKVKREDRIKTFGKNCSLWRSAKSDRRPQTWLISSLSKEGNWERKAKKTQACVLQAFPRPVRLHRKEIPRSFIIIKLLYMLYKVIFVLYMFGLIIIDSPDLIHSKFLTINMIILHSFVDLFSH